MVYPDTGILDIIIDIIIHDTPLTFPTYIPDDK